MAEVGTKNPVAPAPNGASPAVVDDLTGELLGAFSVPNGPKGEGVYIVGQVLGVEQAKFRGEGAMKGQPVPGEYTVTVQARGSRRWLTVRQYNDEGEETKAYRQVIGQGMLNPSPSDSPERRRFLRVAVERVNNYTSWRLLEVLG